MLEKFQTATGNMSEDDGGSLIVDVNVTSFDREYLHWSFIVMEVAAIVVIVIGDIFMLMMFFTRKLLGQSTNILVFSVAIGDLVTGLLALPLAMMQKILVEPSDFLCKGYFYFANVSKTAVGYTILLLAMERVIAVLVHTFRILPPGRCLFFASLTWFFAAAYNIWSVVIYDVEVVTLVSAPERRTKDLFLCFASSRFMYLHDIFEILNPLVTFVIPTVCSSLLFVYFVWNKKEADKPGRPYKSSKSVVIFTFALLVSFASSHLPWEIATLVMSYDATRHYSRQLVSVKVLHLMSFLRGFWDIFIFGAFRHYVCKKEKALAHFREQRSLQVQRSSLAIPLTDRAMSTSLLDSDPSVSRRYSSDVSRRPSAFDDGPSCVHIEQTHLGSSLHPNQSVQLLHPHQPILETENEKTACYKQQEQQHQLHQHHHLGSSLLPRKSLDGEITLAKPGSDIDGEKTILVPVVTVGYLIPRSPCAVDPIRNFVFPPAKCGLDRRMSTPIRHRFGSSEGIQESKEGGDSVSELQTYRKRVLFNRRKSCGDKSAVTKHLSQRQYQLLQRQKQQNEENQTDILTSDIPQEYCNLETKSKLLNVDKITSDVTISFEDPSLASSVQINAPCIASISTSLSTSSLNETCVSKEEKLFAKIQTDPTSCVPDRGSSKTLQTSLSSGHICQKTQSGGLSSSPDRPNSLSVSSRSLTFVRRNSNHLHVPTLAPSFVPRHAYSSD
ncbi:D(4) dopamine receptor-like [Elysia marginata]|uniref:D(4) dopamine receptor-like n=1 Tax=Elysia marginata TaxID=1093978 RepID=A0AAV4JAV4_9GAST|nr:D(4) dopamine receptor-like [Elysia marginata]